MMLPARVAFLAICCLAFSSCSKPKNTVEAPTLLPPSQAFRPPGRATNTPAIYQPFFSHGLSQDKIETVRSLLPFESIALRRTPCFGPCPVYNIVLHREGKAELNAEDHLPKLGKFVGEVSLNTYGRLCYLIENSHFNEMDSSYRGLWTDASTCIVTVTSGATTKSVSDYGGVGPIELWAIQELLDATKNEIEWKPAK